MSLDDIITCLEYKKTFCLSLDDNEEMVVLIKEKHYKSFLDFLNSNMLTEIYNSNKIATHYIFSCASRSLRKRFLKIA